MGFKQQHLTFCYDTVVIPDGAKAYGSPIKINC
jgi:hypothetical protein